MKVTTKTDILKMVVRQYTALKVTRIAQDQIVEHTDLDPDGIPVQIGSFAVGQYTALKARPYTDAAVDKTVQAVKTWLAAARKNATAE